MDQLFKTLDDICPGFRLDKDEAWISFLAKDKQARVRRHREVFLELVEAFESARGRFKAASRNKVAALPLIKKDQDDAKAEVLRYGKRLVIELRELKSEADRIRDRKIRGDDLLLSSSAKKRRIESANFDSTSADTDLVDDDDDDEYMPCIATKAPPVESPSKQSAGRRPRADDFTVPTPQTQPVSKRNDDDILEGVHEEDAEILKELKTQIKKYGCRDRVLEAIESTRVRHDISQKIACLMEDVSNNR